MWIFDAVTQWILGGKVRRPAAPPPPPPKVDKAVLLEKIRQTDLFKNLPDKNLEEMFAKMETVQFREGESVIKQGDEGDYYYLLVNGKAKVLRKMPGGVEAKEVAKLDEPRGFGEEALISNARRNASIIMTMDGTLMRLSKDAFSEYVKEPLVTWLSPKEAQDRIGKGAKWLDVREKGGAKDAHLPGSITISVEEIRQRLGELDKNTFYICYCENGRLSSTAAFLMRQRAFDNVGVLRGGLQSLKRAGIS